MQLPTVHDNGTGKETLIRGYNRAWEALGAAYELLKLTAPNARDYGPEALENAETDHDDRLGLIQLVIDELDDLINAIEEL